MTPTLSVYGEITTKWGAPFLYAAMDNAKRFVDMGGIIGLGNDFIEEKMGNPYELPYLLSNVNFVMKDGIVVKNDNR